MDLQKQIDEILELYTQQRLAELLGISQWKLLEKMKDNIFTESEIKIINMLFELYEYAKSEYNRGISDGKIIL